MMSREICEAGMGGCWPRYSEPRRPCSSAVTAAKMTEWGGWMLDWATGAGHFEEHGYAGAVVGGAVVDVVAGHAGDEAEVVVVGGVEDGLVGCDYPSLALHVVSDA